MFSFKVKNFSQIKASNMIISFIIFTLFLFLTNFFWKQISYNSEKEVERHFGSLVERANFTLTKQMLAYNEIMLSAKSFFYAKDNNISKEKWKIFIGNLNLTDSYPGIQGIGFNRYVKNNEKFKFISQLKNLGMDNFTINPTGERAEYFPVTYIEPQDQRNIRALGFDVYSEPVRKLAIDTALSYGELCGTGKVILKQETSKDIQNGFLLFLPIYSSKQTPVTYVERKDFSLT